MTGSGLSVLVTERSADALTVVVSTAVLLAASASVVVLATMAVLESVEPWRLLALTLTTMVKVAVAPAAKVGTVALTVPVPPTGGVARVKVGPLVWVAETKVVPTGTTSLRDTV